MNELHDPRLPEGTIVDAWRRTQESLPLISPRRKQELQLLVVGTGLAGASAAATLAEQGYQVRVISFHDRDRKSVV